MMARQECEALFLAELDWIREAMAALCRRYGMGAADTEDFASWATLRLIDDDYAVLRKFRGESALRTYLVVVVAMLHREYRSRWWGRWRPSAAARRAGRVAVRLETLVHRDGYPLSEAILRLRTAGETSLSERQLVALFASLPRRTAGGGRPVESLLDALAHVPDPAAADDGVAAEERAAERRALEDALHRALEALPAEDRVILRMRYWEGTSVADIARALGLPQKPLYRRVERALAALRAALEAAGVSRHRTAACLAEWVA
jgi:RNA polymerase sigma factor for flagellar operon FliA